MSASITKIEQHLKLHLVPDLKELYKNSDGEEGVHGRSGPASEGRAMRLLPANEVIEATEGIGRFVSLRDSAVFWGGQNGEFAAVFLDGPLLGRVYIFDYDGRNDSVAYRSVTSFVQSLNAGVQDGADWTDLQTDYYVDSEYFIRGAAVCKPADDNDLKSDRKAVKALRMEYASASIDDEPDHHHYAMNIMGLTPPTETPTILEFLDTDDMWIQERACNILGHRRYEPVVEKLGTIACEGTTNGRGAAIRALGRIGTPAALEAILRSASRFDRGSQYQIADALQACGCAVKKDNIDPNGIQTPDYLYQLPGKTEWRKL